MPLNRDIDTFFNPHIVIQLKTNRLTANSDFNVPEI